MALAHEMVRELYRDVWGSNVLLKLDMAKAYDRLEWPFFLKVLRKLVFPLSGLVSSSSLGILYSESCVMNLITGLDPFFLIRIWVPRLKRLI